MLLSLALCSLSLEWFHPSSSGRYGIGATTRLRCPVSSESCNLAQIALGQGSAGKPIGAKNDDLDGFYWQRVLEHVGGGIGTGTEEPPNCKPLGSRHEQDAVEGDPVNVQANKNASPK